MSIYRMPFTIFVQFALESLASIDVQIKSMDCYFFTVECLHSDSSSDPQHFQIFALASKWTFGWWPQPNVVYMLLLTLGSDTLMKFECSKLLRSSQADQDYISLLCRLSCNLSEPFRSRAQRQLKLILQFRHRQVFR